MSEINIKMLLIAINNAKLPAPTSRDEVYVIPVEDRVQYLNRNRLFEAGDELAKNTTMNQVTLKSKEYRDGERTWREWVLEL